MMSIVKLTPGTVGDYLTRHVAALDSTELGRTKLADYYQVAGESPGRWMGSGLTGLGMKPGDEVTAEQMKYLFEQGRHPLSDQLIEALGPDASDRDKARAIRLGQKFPEFDKATPFQLELARRYDEATRGRSLSATDGRNLRARLRSEVGAELFLAKHGREPLTRNELYGFIAKVSAPPKAVSGFDLTFSPVKSVSTLWALADPKLAALIRQAHDDSVAHTLDWLESSAVFTRRGAGGVRQVTTRGLIAAAFTHRDSRAGNPDLHTHVAVANKVQAEDGTWLALDGDTLYKARVDASEEYNTHLETRLKELGLRFAPRPTIEPGRRPVREIVGVPSELLDAWSVRARTIRVKEKELARRFQDEHGRPPTPIERIELAQQATLATREHKHAPISEATQRARWQHEALGVLGPVAYARMRDTLFGAPPAPAPVLDDAWFDRVAQVVVETIERDRAEWGPTHVRAEASRQARTHNVGLDQLDAAVDRLVATALSRHSVPLDASDDGIVEPAGLRRPDGTSVYVRAFSARYSSARILAAEADLVNAAGARGGRVVDPNSLHLALLQSLANRAPLNPGQRDLVTAMATSDRRLMVAIAPAGTGKTTALRTLAAAWRNSRGHVLGLAPSAAAADQLQEQLGGRTETLHKLAWHLARPEEPLPEWAGRVGPASMLVIDEAGMADTLTLHAVVTWAIGRSAAVRLVGDTAQLGAVGAGGVLRDIDATWSAIRLEEVVRFTDPAEATASLELRDGNLSGLGYYFDHDRVHVGDSDTVLDQVLDAWAFDRQNGLDAIMLAPTREQVAQLNALARDARLGGHLARWEVPLRDGNAASKGDVVITRTNDRRLRVGASDWVRNGDRWLVTRARASGAMTVKHLRTGKTTVLPADYVAASVDLGYATTIHTAQGTTADTCHGILTGAEARQLFYTMASRGRQANHLYLQVTGPVDEHSANDARVLEPPSAAELLEAILARDDGPVSATTLRRELARPAEPLAHAVACYLDAITYAAEQIAEPGLKDAIDRLPSAFTMLEDAPAWPTLRAHLFVIAADGRNPLGAFRAVVEEGPVDDARDAAAVLDHRLDRLDPDAGRRPLPWLPGVPARLAADRYWAGYLTQRAQLVTRLGREVRDEALAATTEPAWLHRLHIDLPDEVVADIAQWRAAHGIPDTDLRPTGPMTHHPAEVRVQEQLNDLTLTDRPAVQLWNRLLTAWAPVLADDPGTALLAQELAHRSATLDGLEKDVVAAINRRPLPVDQPAAALRLRLDYDLRPDRPVIWETVVPPRRPSPRPTHTGPSLRPDEHLVRSPDPFPGGPHRQDPGGYSIGR